MVKTEDRFKLATRGRHSQEKNEAPGEEQAGAALSQERIQLHPDNQHLSQKQRVWGRDKGGERREEAEHAGQEGQK